MQYARQNLIHKFNSKIKIRNNFFPDPCSSDGHTELPYAYQRSVHCQSDITSFCDNYLDPGWYRVASNNNMLTVCRDEQMWKSISNMDDGYDCAIHRKTFT